MISMPPRFRTIVFEQPNNSEACQKFSAGLTKLMAETGHIVTAESMADEISKVEELGALLDRDEFEEIEIRYEATSRRPALPSPT
jgi:hypothetical protein